MVTLAGVTLTFEDIIVIAMWAFIITTLVRVISRLLRGAKTSDNPSYIRKEKTGALKRCYELFPKDIFMFKGQTVKRGMLVRVTTLKKNVFEGKLVGLSSDDVVMCVVTQEHVIAQGIEGVEEILIIE